MAYGRYFEELEVGQQVKHWPGRTITEFDDTQFSLLCMNQHPVHTDEHYARSTQHGRRLVEGPLVISLLIGMIQADVAGRSTGEEYRDIRHLGPVFHGDSIYAESKVIAKKDGRVAVEIVGKNQRDEPVLKMQMTIAVPKRG